jgi:hypothetical protein
LIFPKQKRKAFVISHHHSKTNKEKHVGCDKRRDANRAARIQIMTAQPPHTRPCTHQDVHHSSTQQRVMSRTGHR